MFKQMSSYPSIVRAFITFIYIIIFMFKQMSSYPSIVRAFITFIYNYIILMFKQMSSKFFSADEMLP